MRPPKTASPKRISNASAACIAPRQTRMPHATSFGLDWPFTPKRHEKKPAASSRRRSHRKTHVAQPDKSNVYDHRLQLTGIPAI
jgi:hypothetical protein